MTHAITWVMEADLPEGKRPELEALMHEMCDATRANEPGCQMYDWFVSADGRTCHILERYADEAAMMAHIGTFNRQYARRLFGVIKPRRLTVYGVPSADGQAALAPLRPVFLDRLGG